MSRWFPAALLATLLAPSQATAGAALPAWAQLIAQKENQVSLEEAVRHVERRTGGRVLAARTVHRPKGTFYLVRVLVAQGRVRVFKVNARTGEVD